jgi:phosphate transport system substrate-binding protein
VPSVNPALSPTTDARHIPLRSARRALTLAAAAALVSCSGPTAPASTPSLDHALLSATPIRIYATTATLPLVNDLTSAYGGVYADLQLTFETRTGNYRTLLQYLLNGEMPYFISNHLPPESPLWGAPIGGDAIAVIVHPDNPVSDLSLDQLRLIYQGRVDQWRALGGDASAVVVVSREAGSGTRAEFENRVMGSRQTTGAALIAPSSTAVVDLVAATPGAIGYVSLAHVDRRVRALSVDGVSPSPASVAGNQYPLRTTLYLVGLEAPEGVYRDFADWLQGPSGQAVIARRYVPLLPTPASTR